MICNLFLAFPRAGLAPPGALASCWFRLCRTSVCTCSRASAGLGAVVHLWDRHPTSRQPDELCADEFGTTDFIVLNESHFYGKMAAPKTFVEHICFFGTNAMRCPHRAVARNASRVVWPFSSGLCSTFFTVFFLFFPTVVSAVSLCRPLPRPSRLDVSVCIRLYSHAVWVIVMRASCILTSVARACIPSSDFTSLTISGGIIKVRCCIVPPLHSSCNALRILPFSVMKVVRPDHRAGPVVVIQY